VNLVKHAKRELELIGEDQQTSRGIIKIVQIFANMGHSGMSAEYTIQTLTNLLRWKNLSDLTDDPAEWMFISEDKSGVADGIWQSTRNPEAFSNDWGRNYYLLSEGGNDQNREPLHASRATPCGAFHPGKVCILGDNHPVEKIDDGS
jgi:hypothetical protein